jgi:hypothetical protein
VVVGSLRRRSGGKGGAGRGYRVKDGKEGGEVPMAMAAIPPRTSADGGAREGAGSVQRRGGRTISGGVVPPGRQPLDGCALLHQYDQNRLPVCQLLQRVRQLCVQDCSFMHNAEDIEKCSM